MARQGQRAHDKYSYTLSLKLRVCNGYSVIKLHYYIEGLQNKDTLENLV